jgi:hypothetical protein
MQNEFKMNDADAVILLKAHTLRYNTATPTFHAVCPSSSDNTTAAAFIIVYCIAAEIISTS